MKPLPHLILAAVLLGGGALLGRGLFTPAGRGTSTTDTVAERDGRDQRPGRSPGGGGRGEKKEHAHDLASLKERYLMRQKGNTELRREMERLSPTQLRELVLEHLPMAKPGGDEKEMLAHRMMASAAVNELYKREGEAVMEWAGALEAGDTRREVMACVLGGMTWKDTATTEKWVAAYRKDYGSDQMLEMSLMMDGLKGSAARNDVAAMVKSIEFYDLRTLGNPLSNTVFPKEFDFAALHAALGGKVSLGDAMSQWAARDADAAWDALAGALDKPMDKGAGSFTGRQAPFADVLKGAVAAQGEEAALQWAAARLKSLPDKHRGSILRVMDDNTLSASGVSTLAALLPPAEQRAFAVGLMSNGPVTAKTSAALAALPREEMISVLEKSFQPFGGEPPPAPGPALDAGEERAYENLRTKLSLTDAEMARIRKKE